MIDRLYYGMCTVRDFQLSEAITHMKANGTLRDTKIARDFFVAIPFYDAG